MEKKKIIIIGAGVSGLSAGIYGRLNGYDTEIIEMHSIPGGQCTAWKKKDYTFDYCIHWLVGSAFGSFHEIWKQTGALGNDTRIIDFDEYVCLKDSDGREFIIYTDINRWERYLLEFAPEDLRPIRKMCRDIRRLSSLTTFENAPGSRTISEYLATVFQNGMALPTMMKYGPMSCGEYFSSLNFKNRQLQNFLLQTFGNPDFSAMAFLVTLAWFSQKNAGYPIGGSLPFALRMADKYKNLGGTLTTKRRVKSIIVEDNRAVGITLEDGTEKRADYIISGADLHATMFDMLGGKYISPQIKEAFETWPLFTSVVQVSFGISKAVTTKYHALQIISPGIRIGNTLLNNGYTLADYNHDPLITPEGKCVMKLLFESPWEMWENLSDAEYAAEKSRIGTDATKLLLAQYPDAEGHIDVVDVATPRTDARYTGVWKGAFEGFMPSGKNIMKSLSMKVPGLSQFYLIGQWITPGGGLPLRASQVNG